MQIILTKENAKKGLTKGGDSGIISPVAARHGHERPSRTAANLENDTEKNEKKQSDSEELKTSEGLRPAESLARLSGEQFGR